ncbi:MULTISPECIES: DUF397 domain-containing protein [unclassified Streptomyces]|uniref:DUF397 domain-containing protein n=1 Tax=unclassified Streptomyces TaxID=2593676 RepID=UPI0022B60362|nr:MULTISPECIES: DUF397 domain-containing protein [unclassified Streptomyces]MCZ7417517.1 DUF397 domain-containing protein [Streptomyces sp. WMMC897]MCZ7432654.1 DUF397 domain-containing protein [Streptomyces sp. WMMC1477]
MGQSRQQGDSEASWFKSSYSGGSGTECVEVAFFPHTVTGVRDSKVPAGRSLEFGEAPWGSFVAALRAGGLA